MDEKDTPEKKDIFEKLKWLKIFDPLGIYDTIEYIRNEKFFIEERFKNRRERLKSFIDSIVEFFDLDFFTEKFYSYIGQVLNKLFSKTFQFEFDLAGVKNLILNLYPIRKLLEQHKKVIDILEKY